MIRCTLLHFIAQTIIFSFCYAKSNPPSGFISLFNGVNLDGWWGAKTEDPSAWKNLSPAKYFLKWQASLKNIHTHWTVEDGVLVNDGHGLFLTTEKNFGDFELRLEYKTFPNADSGVYLRGVPQVQIWDTTKEGGKWKYGADEGSGGLWNNGSPSVPGRDPLVHADKPFGEWNQLNIKMTGDRVTVNLNQKLVVNDSPLMNYWDRRTPVNKRKPLISKGPIQLQTHGGEIRWKNIFLKEISKSSSNNKIDSKAFSTIFNGKDFSGWSGAVKSYEVTDSALQCKPGKGGTLYTNKRYRDFWVKLDIKIPAGGNNGLALRYPGKGDPAYMGMCELQVLDDMHPRHSMLDPRQYHGSAYGMAPAMQGYLKPVGEWNQQEVIVKGSEVSVFLNSKMILNTDLSKTKDFMGNKKYPGRLLKEGHFGFAGHGDSVAFKNVRILEFN